jgi:hypothetical protein
MEKERKIFTKKTMLLRDNIITKCIILERSASTMELSKTGLRHEHALLSYTKKREKNTQEAMQLWNGNTSKSLVLRRNEAVWKLDLTAIYIANVTKDLIIGRKPMARKFDKTTFCTANATENLASDGGTATRKLDKTIMYVVSIKRHARDEVASRKFSSVSMCHELATVINEKEGLDDHSTRQHSISLTLPHRIVWGKCTAARKLSSVSMCHGLATAINVKREWTKTHKGDVCAADATRPFVLGRSGQYGCSWPPIVH